MIALYLSSTKKNKENMIAPTFPRTVTVARNILHASQVNTGPRESDSSKTPNIKNEAFKQILKLYHPYKLVKSRGISLILIL